MSWAKTPGKHIISRRHRQGGFTLIEIVMVIIVLGIVAAIAIPRMGSLNENARINATKSELLMLKRAIIGSPAVTAGGRFIDRGFEGDIGHSPASLAELGAKPDSLPPYDRFTRYGWNGPYIDAAGGEFLKDAWACDYVYDPIARTISSVGGLDTLVISF
jgi:prepilin-type N-terminal cleavage/methylation domain-containing protein